MKTYFTSIGLSIFDTILSREQVDPIVETSLWEAEIKNIILYIVVAHSEDSPLLILRRDAKEEKVAIFEYLQIPEYQRPRLANMEDEEVRAATTQYLQEFAGYEFRNLQFMKMQYADWDLAITNRAFTTTDDDGKAKFDIKEQMKAVMETRRLSKEIEKIERELQGRTKYLAVGDMKSWKDRKNKVAGGGGNRGGNIANSDLIQ